MSIQLPIASLKAALICSAKKDVRYYLQGVCIDVLGAERANIVATDGHILIAIKLMGRNTMATGQVIIPRDKLEVSIKLAGKASHVELVHIEEKNYSIGGIAFAHNGGFPDYMRVIPGAHDVPCVPYHADTVLLERMARAFSTLRNASKKYTFRFDSVDGNKIVCHDDTPDAVGVVMCWRAPDVTYLGFN